jgi:hypothetical protein
METQTYEESLASTGVILADFDPGTIEQIALMKDAIQQHHAYCNEHDPYAYPLDLPISLCVTAAFNDFENNGMFRLIDSIESQIWRLQIKSDNRAAAKLALLLRDFKETLEVT